jgi:hypothetical protein
MSEENINEIEKDIIKIKGQLENICLKLEDMPTINGMKVYNNDLVEKIFNKADNKYAKKHIEKVVYLCSGAVGLYVINQLLNLI